MIKFPTEYGIGELRGDQVVARECYIAMLEMEDHQQTMCIGEQQTIAESVEELEEVILDESRLGRTTRMGTLASPMVREDLASFLRMIRVESRRHAGNRSINNSPQAKS